MRLFGIKNCGSVKKARDFLDSRNIDYEFIDLKIQKPQISDIKKWIDKKGIDVVLNSKGSTYKKLGLKNLNLDLSAKIGYCHDNPLLLKRPIIDDFGNDNVVVGFDEAKYKEIFN
ncbi:arsenate reductase family protein [Helicobacter cappadocius]|uniref:Arsenate reductase family protein n=1 Tax=Helicobacter cappadocius TaxID=3063998 RepID=A0AA90ST30_9HELI|nr:MULTISPECIES: arsenate reductase family protein [unclassified Helicobacter]MDO7253641.1 arsenate reductase family protein [Helicobacter sp. faydin-H75]MDP2539569.1 arsenate reductase family protein [Helicobacter sp. faydin-H76]